MPLTDMPLARLREYRPEIGEPDDFDDFWASTLAEARAIGGTPEMVPVEVGFSEVEVFDVTIPGFAGDPVRGWFLLPRSITGALPVIVQFLGYNGGRGLPHERLAWAAAGFANLVMDTRGQGSGAGSGGATRDPHGSGPAAPGFTTRGIEDPRDYFYRRVYTDAARAVDAVRGFERVDPERIVLTGASQGGGSALAAAGLISGVVAVMPDMPFLSDLPRALQIAARAPYAEIVRYLSVHRGRADEVLRTLSYFDGVHFARRSAVPALYSVGLMDPVCPPSTVFASFNHYAGRAQIEVYPYNEHEGGGAAHWVRQRKWLDAVLASASN